MYAQGIARILARWRRRYPQANPNRWDGTSVRAHVDRKQAWEWVRRVGSK